MNLPSRSPNWAPMERAACFQRLFFYVSLRFPDKQWPPVKSKSHLLSKFPVKRHLFPGPPVGPLWRKTSVSTTFQYISCRIPNKRAISPSQNPHRERETLHFYSPLLLSLEVPGKQTSPPASPMGTLWRKMCVSRAFLYISFGVPCKEALPPGSPCRDPINRDVPFPEPSFTVS
jgi:hypothetical protein